MFGTGYSQSYGMTTSVQLSQNNFLGGGNRVSVEASRSSYLQRYGFSYTNPYFTDDGVSLGYNLSGVNWTTPTSTPRSTTAPMVLRRWYSACR